MRRISIPLLVFFAVFPLLAQEPFEVREAGEGPSRSFHVLHYRIDIRLDEHDQSVAGTTTVTVVPYHAGVGSIRLNAAKMAISSVTMGKETFAFMNDSSTVTIDLGRPRGPADTLALAIAYSCHPTDGMTWAAPDSGYPNKRWQIWSQEIGRASCRERGEISVEAVGC